MRSTIKITQLAFALLLLCGNFLNAQVNYQYDADGRLIADLSEGIASIEWNNHNKVVRIIRSDTCHTPDIEFTYDALGNRISKLIKPRDGTKLKPQYDWQYIYYVYDASGKPMTLYQRNFSQDTLDKNLYSDKIYINEQHLYPSSRIGYYGPRNFSLAEQRFEAATDSKGMFVNLQGEQIVITSLTSQNFETRCGEKFYTLQGNHGNVLALINNRKTLNNPQRYHAEIFSATDYYPFGMTLPARNFNDEALRYGFADKEIDREIKGNNNSYDFNARLYDPRLGKWLSIDPLQRKYPSHSSYNFALNSPIMFSDPDGKSVVDSKGNPVQIDMQEKEGKWSVQLKFDKRTSKAEQRGLQNGTLRRLNLLAQTEAGRKIIEELKASKRPIEFSLLPPTVSRKLTVSWDRVRGKNPNNQATIFVSENQLHEDLRKLKRNLDELDVVINLLNKANTKSATQKLEGRREALEHELMSHQIIPGMNIQQQREFLNAGYEKNLTAFFGGVILSALRESYYQNLLPQNRDTFDEIIVEEVIKIDLAKNMIQHFQEIQRATRHDKE